MNCPQFIPKFPPQACVSTSSSKLWVVEATREVTNIFVTSNLSVFLLQLAGGGMQTINSMRNLGQKILVVGRVVQLIFFGFFFVVSGSFQMRLRRAGVDWLRPHGVGSCTSYFLYPRWSSGAVYSGSSNMLMGRTVIYTLMRFICISLIRSPCSLCRRSSTSITRETLVGKATSSEEYINLQDA
ncbi:hypothetical protein BJX63DRAFT_1468 [Aspergillus granulosus]|uniref:Uncharacterized protein n=1 Tax=Aspergillus granulosus TaxID=176169 RepID=A0ABR4I587_9EURO